jgi:hypothetical protein
MAPIEWRACLWALRVPAASLAEHFAVEREVVHVPASHLRRGPSAATVAQVLLHGHALATTNLPQWQRCNVRVEDRCAPLSAPGNAWQSDASGRITTSSRPMVPSVGQGRTGVRADSLPLTPHRWPGQLEIVVAHEMRKGAEGDPRRGATRVEVGRRCRISVAPSRLGVAPCAS